MNKPHNEIHRRPVRIANCSGYYGDRLSAAAEIMAGEPIDVLTGDWLAELTMSILAKSRARGGSGYAHTFIRQLTDVLDSCYEQGVRIVANAGGVAPQACAERVVELGRELGHDLRVAIVDGDDITGRIDELRTAGERFEHLDDGKPWDGDSADVLAANAYLGGHAVTEALRAGADVVITGRVADAALVSGAAAWWHDWTPDDFHALAGATVAGHAIECGTQVTGGNYAFFGEIADPVHPGFPIAEICRDGSSVITKQPGTGGEVTIGTVTAQLLYEIGSPRYVVPDVVVRFDTVELTQLAPDQVLIRGVRGEPAPDRAKALLTYPGGYRNSMTVAIVGLDRAAKAALVERAVWNEFPCGRAEFAESRVEIIGAPLDSEDSVGQSYVRISVADPDRDLVGKRFSSAVVATSLANYPGLYLTGPPGDASQFLVGWPTLIDVAHVPARLRIGEIAIPVPTPTTAAPMPDVPAAVIGFDATADGSMVVAPLGRVVGARSGDKGGNANLGLWVRDRAAYAWLAALATPERIRELLPETADLEVRCYPLPNLLAVNIVIVGLLGRGVAASLREDPQAKSLGERFRAITAAIPAALLSRDPQLLEEV
ncbi:acyclic terpene utilization AtuA family protein [Nocardia sp. NPDC052278]|uniref:acyclic terpene utilization AtuA family protein n=1 Tax=unclassified Nocardia TaxID=2637762 RepID=UPI0036B4E553